MKILITAPSLDTSTNVSGLATLVNTIMRHNQDHQYYHYLLGRPDKPLNKLMWILQLIKQLLFFPVFLKKNKIELVHQNLPFDPKGVLREYLINLWCRLLCIPVVLHIHGGLFMTEGTKSKFFRKLSNSLFQKSKSVIVLSEIEYEVLKEKFSFSGAIILPNCIDISIFTRSSSIKMKVKPNILYLGRIEEKKGIYELIEALNELKKNFDFHFILCGAGPLLEYSIETCSNSLGDDFEYKGVVFGEAKIKIIEQSDLFVLPSYFEGLPIALLETMAAGVVPIVTNVGSMKQIINHNVNGMHVEKQNSNDLYEKLKYILTNPNQYQKLSNNAQSTIRTGYNIEKYIVKLNEIY